MWISNLVVKTFEDTIAIAIIIFDSVTFRTVSN